MTHFWTDDEGKTGGLKRLSVSVYCMFMEMVTSAQVGLCVCLHTCVIMCSFSLVASTLYGGYCVHLVVTYMYE